VQPKSEKCIFVGYFEDVKDYRLLQPHCNEIIIRRDVKFDENILACEPNSVFLPFLACAPNSAVLASSACEPSLAPVPSFVLVSSSNDDSEDENTPPPAHLPPDESFEPEPALTPSLPRWVCSTREAIGDLVGDPSYQRRTCSEFVNVYAIIIVLCISIDNSNIKTRSLRNTQSQETQHLSWETL
jgi:hypothetical protein